MAAKQRLHRDSINLMVQVEVAQTGARIGHLIDVSMGGIGVSGHREMLEPMDKGTMDLVLPWPMHNQNRIRLEVERSWLRTASEGRWHAGYRILSCSEAGALALEHLAARFSGAE